jgi:tetratricopeptide (TPR) repeat protein
MRRVMAVTGVVALVALAMGAMTMVALQARSDAEAQRDAAEGLVEYMISDLRSDLEGVGRLDIMEGVDARALKYYQDQSDLENFPAESLLRRGRVVEAMGQNEELRGNADQALKNYRELYRTTGELLARDPDDPARALAHAWAENRLATFEAATAQPETIKARLDRALELLIGIESWGSDRADWWKTYALSSGNQCAISVLAGQSDDATRRHCENAIAGGRRWAELGGGGQADYGTVFNLVWLAKLEDLRGNDRAARRAAADALRLSNRMIAGDPQNANFLSQRMEILAQVSISDPALREDRLREAVAIADRLIAGDPDNAHLKELRTQYQSKLRGAGK